jgi:hypothetical protein
MSTEELEIEVLKLAPHDRARLAEKLLQSLKNLSDEERQALKDVAFRRQCIMKERPASEG